MIMGQSVTAADDTVAVAVAVTGSGGAGVMTAGDMLLQQVSERLTVWEEAGVTSLILMTADPATLEVVAELAG